MAKNAAKKKTAKRTAKRKNVSGRKTPKKNRMSREDIKLFKKLLIEKRMNILKEITHITKETLSKSQREASGDLSGYSYHMADMASDVYERDLLLQLASGEREILLKIDDALKRMEEGEYGLCFSCKKKISKVRLKAIPHALYCHDCQEKEEKGAR